MPSVRNLQPFQKKILNVIRRGPFRPLSERTFNALALQTYVWQRQKNEVYERYCRTLKAPLSLKHWRQIPALPVAAFKSGRVTTFKTQKASRVFTTSGTTTHKKGKHYFNSLIFYDAAIKTLFKSYVMNGLRKYRILSLIPKAVQKPQSSLSYMVHQVIRHYGKPKTFYAIKNNSRFDVRGLLCHLAECEKSHEPVLVVTTTLALAFLLNVLEQKNICFRLPKGSRMMETGGSKGRRLMRVKLLRDVEKRLGLPKHRVINEYGMTELSSQFYGNHQKRMLPWARVMTIDGLGENARLGRRGLIRVVDLANQGSCAFLQTEDEGRLKGNHFEVLGRLNGAELRGCSLDFESMEKLFS
jgi:hypothetical protein